MDYFELVAMLISDGLTETDAKRKAFQLLDLTKLTIENGISAYNSMIPEVTL